MWKAVGILLLLFAALHFLMLAQTGYMAPCNAAFARLEYEELDLFKNRRRWIDGDDKDRAALYDGINHREILHCYRIALFGS
ncbi:MAG: hypothetical protein WBX25_36080 [Rhodomicrobium sp.]